MKCSLISNSSMRRILLLLLVFSVFTTSGTAFPFFKRKKKAQSTQSVKKSAYERILSEGLTESVRGTFVSFHKTDGRILMELPKQSLGRDMLIGVTISSVSNPKMADLGFKNSNLVHVRFIEKDSAVVMQVVNTDLFVPKNRPSADLSARLNYDNLDFFSFPIKARNGVDGAVLFDASSFILKENRFFPVITKSVGSYSVSSSLKDNLTRVTKMKVFDQNASIGMDRHFIVSLSGKKGSPITNYPVTIGVNFTLALLPNELMTPRLSDTRVGMFLVNKDVLKEDGSVDKATFVKRWRIVPKDTAAYFAGNLCEPTKPIVYYVENTFPPLWKRAIKAGILWWNKAFERIGFKNVMQVADFPTDDPNFDPDDFKYSCIRYLPTDVENAMGPSWTDPRTGEVINATVLVYNDVVNTINNWRFVQTAQIDPLARATQMPDSITEETLEYIIAHEIGHTLGFMHNMAASAALPTDSLRSPSFTQKYGTTASIMDYARFNYVAQPTDHGVKLTPPCLGVYDFYAVEWAYRLFPNSKGFEDDAKQLRLLVEKHEGDPFYRYGLQQTGTRYDPSAIEEDLGDDPVKSSTYGMDNLRMILNHLDHWIADADDNNRKAELYNELLSQAIHYVRIVSANVPGVYLYHTSEKSGLPRYKVVPKAKQKESVQWLLKQARTFATLGNDTIEKKLPYGANKPFKILARDVQSLAMMSASKLAISYYLDSTSYSPIEYMEDVYQDVFGKTIAGKENLSVADLSMQRLYVDLLQDGIADMKQAPNVHNLHSDVLPENAFVANLLQRNVANDEHNGCCYLTGKQRGFSYDTGFLNFGNGYGEPEPLWGTTVNRTSEFQLAYAQKLLSLLGSVIPNVANPELKAHYMLLEKRLKKYLK